MRVSIETSMRVGRGAAFASIFFAAAGIPLANAQILPSDAKQTCTVPAATFATWFQSGSPALNGVVNPANSGLFPNPIDNCPFYQWSEQMFMWLTSPAPSIYGGGSRVFDTDVFYDVSPPDASGQRQFLPHAPGLIRFFPLRAAQVGPHGLQVLLDKAGNMLEVVHPLLSATGKPLIRNTAGRLVEVSNIKVGRAGKAIFLDKAERVIRVPEVERGKTVPVERILPGIMAEMVRNPAIAIVTTNPRLLAGLNPARTVQNFLINGIHIFVNFSGNVVEVEQGQADGSVLLTQSGQLVYFAAIVNDVYAYFLTGTKDGGITPAPTSFPTTQSALTQIQSFATAHGGPTFTDGVALTMELKTAWVEASTLTDPSSYVTTTGTTKTVQLALVGMHVVGSVNGHPEMIWATFEHVGNTPLGTFNYDNASSTQTVTQTTTGTWLFAANGAAAPFNTPHADFIVAPNIERANGFPISGSNTLRWKPFGGGFNQAPNPLAKSTPLGPPTTSASNTQVISINNNIQGMMASAGAGADVRNNYIMSGATWTAGGVPPTTPFPGGNEVGTSRLTNSTMETYQQGPDNNANGFNCLDCHQGNMLGDTFGGGLSHIFGTLKVLF
jgi:hypothetical protein